MKSNPLTKSIIGAKRVKNYSILALVNGLASLSYDAGLVIAVIGLYMQYIS